MFLQSLTFEDRELGWKIDGAKFGPLNLLVGGSGVGKTLVLRAIRQLSSIAEPRTLPAVSFDAKFEHDGDEYRWQLTTERVAAGTMRVGDPIVGIVARHEVLESLREGELIRRTPGGLLFRGKTVLNLMDLQSALTLINEPSVTAARLAIAGFPVFLDHPGLFAIVPRLPIEVRYPDLGALRAHVSGGWLLKTYALQERFAEEFSEIKARFIDIFPSVTDVRVVCQPEPERGLDVLSLEIHEAGVANWISSRVLSEGMIKTLATLVEVFLATPGSLIVLDEFENSLGANCLAPLTEFILSRAEGIQYLFTSHHPYVINKIPMSAWQLVTRRGGVVRLTPAAEIAALQGASAQDAFTRLINAPEFEEGIS